MPSGLFDYQEYVARYAIKKGRCAVFLDTGLGKTIIELKDSYYKQAIRNLATVKSRFDGDREARLFDEQAADELSELESTEAE